MNDKGRFADSADKDNSDGAKIISERAHAFLKEKEEKKAKAMKGGSKKAGAAKAAQSKHEREIAEWVATRK